MADCCESSDITPQYLKNIGASIENMEKHLADSQRELLIYKERPSKGDWQKLTNERDALQQELEKFRTRKCPCVTENITLEKQLADSRRELERVRKIAQQVNDLNGELLEERDTLQSIVQAAQAFVDMKEKFGMSPYNKADNAYGTLVSKLKEVSDV